MSSKYVSTKSERAKPQVQQSCSARWLDPKNYTKIVALRALLIVSLLAAAAVCSTMSYVLLSDKETHLFETQYSSISDSALNGVVESFERMNLGLQELASIYGSENPNAENWPNIVWNGFYPAATILSQLSQLDNIWFSPIVRPEELVDYEQFIGEYYANEPYIPKPFIYPPGSGLQMGDVWAINWTSYTVYKDTTGVTPLSPNVLLSPIAQLTYSRILGPEILGYNVHAEPMFAKALDSVLACTSEYNHTVSQYSCGATSDAIPLTYSTISQAAPVIVDLKALLVHPIFPANDTSTMRGFASGAMSWKALLAKVVPTFVTGLDCVIKTDTQQYTYTITNGVPMFTGVGDLHDHEYSDYARSRELLPRNGRSASTTYTLSFYPRDEFVSQYTSTIPIWAAVLLILVFVFCSVVFLAYDLLMQREFDKRQAVLDTKRRFVRFISHEIRTPLNTVRLGLKLFDVELSKFCTEIKTAALVDLPALVNVAIDSWRNLTDDILSNSESAVEVLDDLLNYDKIEVGNLRLEYSLFNIVDLVCKTASIMQIQAQQKGISLTLSGANDVSSKSGGSGSVSAAAPLTSEAPGLTPFSRRSSRAMSTSRAPSLQLLMPNSMVAGDISRLGQVLRNLISNALKFTPADGSVAITVESMGRATSELEVPPQALRSCALFKTLTMVGGIRISVSDSGTGLTTQQLSQICSEGVQFNANELQAGQGSGLGLFISKGIVELHGGRLTVTSDGLDKGVTFTVELPLFESCDIEVGSISSAPPPAAALSPTAPSKQAPIESSKQPPTTSMPRRDPSLEATYRTTCSGAAAKRMLVVDDSSFNRKMLVRLLAAKGYTCDQAVDGQDALNVYNRLCDHGEHVDAVLMDFEMPVMNGPTATKKLRELGCTALIVGVTGNVLPDEVAFFKQHGADSVLPKPLVLEDFEEILVNRSLRLLDNSGNMTAPKTTSQKQHSFSAKSPARELANPSSSAKIHPTENV